MNKIKSFADRFQNIKINEYCWKVITILYAAFLIIINFVRIIDNNFWGDEAYSIKLAKMSVGSMLNETAKDVHPPLYYLNLILANRVLGNHGWVYHLVSFIPFLIALLFGLIIIKRLYGREVSLFFITFLGIADAAIKYNVEARMYSLAAMYVLLAFYAFRKILYHEKYGCVLFTLFSLGAAYSHYYAMMSVAFFYLALLVLTIGKRFELKKLLAVYICTICGYLPWLFQMVKTFERTSQDFWMEEVPGFVESLPAYFSSGRIWYSWGMFIITFACLVVFICRDKRKTDKSKIKLGDDSIWLMWGAIAAIGTLLLGEFISVVFRPAFMVRYLYPVIPVLWLVLCVAISKLRYNRIIILILMLVTLFVYGLMYLDSFMADYRSNIKCENTQKELLSMTSTNDVILTDIDHLKWTILDYYFPDNRNKLITNGFDGFDAETNYWILWSEDFTKEDEKWISSQGYKATEMICDGDLGTHEVHVYKLDIIK